MADHTSNSVLDHRRHTRARVAVIGDGVRRLGTRTNAIERPIPDLDSSHLDHLAEPGKLERRVDRIERRLDLGE